MLSSFSTALVALSALATANALSSCVVFDTAWNLYVLGGTEDVNLGVSPWSTVNATTLPTTGRPPYTGQNLTCYLSQYNDAFYLLGADSSNTGDIYIYNPSSSTWSTQTTTSTPDLSAAGTILDHDTNTFFTLSGSTFYQLDFSAITNAATSSSLAWTSVESSPFASTYTPTMALASNHIMFYGAPDVAAGSADIFVIHYSTFQNASQEFTAINGSSTFPDSHGQATSFWLDSNDAQLQMAFVPDDFSSTYVVTHWTSPSTAGSTSGAPTGISSYINSTQSLPAPTSKDASSSYIASDTTLVQLDSAGALYYLPAFASSGGYEVSSSATWSKIDYTLSGASTTGSSSSSASSSSASSSTVASSASTSSASAASATSKTTGATSAKSAASSAAAAASSVVSSKSGAWKAVRVGELGLVGSLLVGLGAFILL